MTTIIGQNFEFWSFDIAPACPGALFLMPDVIFDILTLKIRSEFIVKKCGPKITILSIRMYALFIKTCST
jgi:hypothetical protein